MADVLCVGNIVADVVGKSVDALPKRGTLALIERIELHLGGCAANISMGLAKLGVKIALVGRVGEDGLGDFALQRLESMGVDVGGVERDREAPTSAAIVAAHSDGERSFLHAVGASANLDEAAARKAIQPGKILCIAPAFLLPALDGLPMARLLEAAQHSGLTTVVDTGWDSQGRWLELFAPCLPHIDVFLPSRGEAQELAGGNPDPAAMARFFLDRGVRIAGIKLGSEGCYVASQAGEAFAIPARTVSAVDTLGAGNAFVAGFIAGLTHGWKLEQCARFANATAADCITALGATTGIRSFDETEAQMKRDSNS